ncbi:MAG: hypothetical protein Ct9H300mP5_4620 [Candidatus Pelagibacterales bacterium]|nr:MAG: hypothetical protein Ct9H300mP5_4620 [Pelagibacterales bacterium]
MGAEKTYQKDFFGKRYIGANINSPLYLIKLLNFMGQKALKLKKIFQIKGAVEAALKCNKPAVIDVDVDRNALYSFRKNSFKHKTK